MNAAPVIIRDERTIAVEQASYIWAYCFITFALLIDVMIRSYFFNEAAWDLMAFVFIGGGISTIYQYKHNALTEVWKSKAWLSVMIGIGVVSVVIAVSVALLVKYSHG